MLLVDPVYVMFMLPALIVTAAAHFYVVREFSKWKRVRSPMGMSGADVAKRILETNGIPQVTIRQSRGFLTDHYNPVSREIALSPDVFFGKSVSAIAVAAHEAGHAIQHHKGYLPMHIRSYLVPAVSFGSYMGWLLILAGMILNVYGLALTGLVLFSATLLFSLVTLPVEFDASRRALESIRRLGLPAEGMDRVLRAAALTYVASAFASLMQFLYYAMLVFGLRRND